MTNDEVRYAGFVRRLLGSLCDYFLLLIPNCIAIYFVAYNSYSLRDLLINFLKMVAFVSLPMVFISLLYSILLIHYFGTTIGKALAGITILSESGQKLSIKMVFFRQTVAKMISSSMFGLGYWSIIKNPKKQAWHDEIVASVARTKGQTWPIGLLFLLLTFALTIFLIVNTVKGFANNNSLKSDIGGLINSFKEKTKIPNPKEKISLKPQADQTFDYQIQLEKD